MSLHLEKYMTTNIIDRTLYEVYSKNGRMSRLDIIDLCWMIKDIGVDYLEIDLNILKKIKKMPSGLDFVYRIDSYKSLEEFLNCNINIGIIVEDIEDKCLFYREMVKRDKKVILEYRCNNIKDFYALKNIFIRDKDILNGSLVRIIGLSRITSPTWCNILNRICQQYNVGITICAENTCYNATAITLEALMYGIVSVTTSFSGFGANSGYAPLEQVLTAATVIIGSQDIANLGLLPDFKKRFQKSTGIILKDSLPVIGNSIFRYESGIHADAIFKNPNTYEPFDPEMVGLKRKLTIGKHSGKKSVQKKLEELDIEYTEEDMGFIVDVIRKKSISLRRDLTDDEIHSIFEGRTVSGL